VFLKFLHSYTNNSKIYVFLMIWAHARPPVISCLVIYNSICKMNSFSLFSISTVRPSYSLVRKKLPFLFCSLINPKPMYYKILAMFSSKKIFFLFCLPSLSLPLLIRLSSFLFLQISRVSSRVHSYF
jgi:hypothetical protein